MSKNKKSKNSLEVAGNSASQNKADVSIFLTVLSYCILIIFLPVISFFLSRLILGNFENLSSTTQNIYSAVVAVVTLHIALGLYLMRAYSDGDKPKQVVKQD